MTGEAKVRVGPQFLSLRNQFRAEFQKLGIRVTDRQFLESLAIFIREEKLDPWLFARLRKKHKPRGIFSK